VTLRFARAGVEIADLVGVALEMEKKSKKKTIQTTIQRKRLLFICLCYHFARLRSKFDALHSILTANFFNAESDRDPQAFFFFFFFFSLA
jgi:hypothetical protein